MSYKLGWIGSAAFQAFRPDGRDVVFDLAEGVTMPSECKEGDEIVFDVHSDHPANIAMGMNAGYYDVTHVKSGKTFQIPHKTSEWRFDKKCPTCDLRIEKSGDNFILHTSGRAIGHHLLRQAYEREMCPVCGGRMRVVTS